MNTDLESEPELESDTESKRKSELTLNKSKTQQLFCGL